LLPSSRPYIRASNFTIFEHTLLGKLHGERPNGEYRHSWKHYKQKEQKQSTKLFLFKTDMTDHTRRTLSSH
jgi:hypothetical protein